MAEQTLVVWPSPWTNFSSELEFDLAFASAACNNESISVALVAPLQSSTEKEGRKKRLQKLLDSYHVSEKF